MPEWFETPDDSGRDGLRFSCTMCGNCCTGPEGYVLVSDDDVTALAARAGVSREAFVAGFTKQTLRGLSLAEKQSPAGLDCVFLDREQVPGRAVCGVYEDRPVQCRTWPFWKSNLSSRFAWERAKRTCPGMDQGERHSVQQIRICRDKIDI